MILHVFLLIQEDPVPSISRVRTYSVSTTEVTLNTRGSLLSPITSILYLQVIYYFYF